MWPTTRSRFIITGLLACLGLPGIAAAGTITAATTFSTPGSSTGSVGPVGATPSPNNDNESAASPNTIPYSVFFNTFGTLETEFAVNASGGTTEYRFTQTFINNTGVLWAGFRFELGFGLGANFTPSTTLDLLDFDTPDQDPAPSSAALTLLSHSPDTLEWGGATVPSIGVVNFAFAIDVPDGVQTFTLRQAPAAVPEPATVALTGAALAALALITRKSR